MKYVVYFDIAAILLNAMLILTVYLRRTYPTRTCFFYKILLWLNMISSIADLTSAYTISYPTAVPLWCNYLVSVIYLTAHNLSVVVFLLYVIMLIRNNLGTKPERILWQSIVAIDVLLIGTSPFTKFVFYFNDELEYVNSGYGMYFLYVSAFALLLYSLVLFTRHRRIMSPFQMATNIAFLSLIVAAIAFQFYMPEILIESFSASVAFMMMNVALDNPAIYFYQKTNCYNSNAFNYTLDTKITRNDRFAVLAFTFDDFGIFAKEYGEQLSSTLEHDTIDVCHKIFGPRHVYSLSNQVFAIVFDRTKVPDFAIERLSASVGKIRIGTKPLHLEPHFCIVTYPGTVESVSDITSIIETMLNDIYQKSGERVMHDDSKFLEMRRREEQIVHILHEAIQNDGFDIYYQPICEVESGNYVSAEALIRLREQPLDGYIGPDEFIPIAEKNGLILDIGEIVFEKACRFFRNSDLGELGIRYLEVNLSMLQLLERSNCDRLLELCNRYGLSPSNFNLEVTETASTTDSGLAQVNDSITYLREQGFTFSLDDYGTGFSTATYLAEMPFSIVKIDKGILWNAMKFPSYGIVLESMISLIRAFGRKCVVEGVETQEMIDTLNALGCEYHQGYFYAKPLPAEAFTEFLRANKPKENAADVRSGEYGAVVEVL